MAEERFDIEVVDKVATTVAPKMRTIADQAERAGRAVDHLNQALGQTNGNRLNQVARAANANSQALLRQAQATAATQRANASAASATARLAQAQATQARSANQTAISQQKLAQATANTAKAQAQAAAAAARLQAQQARLNQTNARGSSQLTGLGSGAAAYFSGREILQAADSYQLLQNRIKSVTASEQERISVQEQVVRIANETFQSTEAVAILYQRLSGATKALNLQQKDLFTLISNVSKAFALSGATAEESRGAIIQLSQAIGSDFKTSSQELNTILEQAPIVADVFAQQLGTTRGQIKALAKDGQLSAKDFIKAFSDTGKGIDELKARFGQLTPSISQAGQVFANQFQQAIGTLGEVTGASDGLSKSIIFLSKHMEVVAFIATALFPILISGFVKSEIAAAAFNTTLLKNPFLIGGSIFVGAIAGLAVLTQKSETIKKIWEAMTPVVTRAIDAMTGGLASAGFDQWITNATFGLAQVGEGIDVLDGGLTSFGEDTLRTAINMQKGLNDVSKSATDAAAHLETIAEHNTRVAKQAAGANTEVVKTLDEWNKQKLDQNLKWIEAYNQRMQTARERTLATLDALRALAQQSINEDAAPIHGGQISHYGLRGDPNKSYQSVSGIRPPSRAYGGQIHGPGTGTSDSILASVSNGEYVMPAAQTKKFFNVLETMRAGNINIPQYAAGGKVGGKQELFNIKDSAVFKNSEATQLDPLSIFAAEHHTTKDALRASGYGYTLNISKQKGIVPFLVYRGPDAFSDEIKDSLVQSANNIRDWTSELSAWWLETQPTLAPGTAASRDASAIYQDWQKELQSYMLDPFPVKPDGSATPNGMFGYYLNTFQKTRQELSHNAALAGLMKGAPVWNETLGKYVDYRGPSYGATVNYGGDAQAALDYSKKDDLANQVAYSKRMLSQLPINIRDGIGLPNRKDVREGFAEGGSFIVPGSGGPDSKAIAMMVSPGEEVSVRTPSQQRANGGGDTHFSIEFNINGATNPQEWKRSEAQIIGRLARKLDEYRAKQ